MWLFVRKPIVDADTARWHADNYAWPAAWFGRNWALAAATLVLPKPGFFPLRENRATTKASRIFERVKRETPLRHMEMFARIEKVEVCLSFSWIAALFLAARVLPGWILITVNALHFLVATSMVALWMTSPNLRSRRQIPFRRTASPAPCAKTGLVMR